jgi:hypothetical protein
MKIISVVLELLLANRQAQRREIMTGAPQGCEHAKVRENVNEETERPLD